jgi:hypothetical protein
MKFAKSGKGGKRHSHEVANTTDIENDLIGTLIEEAAAEESDHRMKVLLVLGRSVNDRGGQCVVYVVPDIAEPVTGCRTLP